MKQASESVCPLLEKPLVAAVAEIAEEPEAAGYDATGVIAIDFRSPEFNQSDDLSDCCGNYRYFESLDGIVTADMRHQMERRSRKPVDLSADEATPSRGRGCENDDRGEIEAAAALIVVSKGRTLIIDADAERALACGRILTGRRLDCTLLVTNDTSAGSHFPEPIRSSVLEVERVLITGAFGGFSATVVKKGEQKHLSAWLDGKGAPFDLVLDLQAVPSFMGDSLPIGYYAPGPDPSNLDAILMELPEMRGRFEKPQFIFFQKSRCFHGRSRTTDCRRCLDICPFGAIQSVNRKISIDQYICQGCGGCALVCPAAAIAMYHRAPEELLNRLRIMLLKAHADDALPLTLMIADQESAAAGNLFFAGESDKCCLVTFEVEQTGDVGLEMILEAFVHGAHNVTVVCGPGSPVGIRKAVEWQVRMANAILRGLRLPEDSVRFGVIGPPDLDSGKPASASIDVNMGAGHRVTQAATLHSSQDKRALTRRAAQKLYDDRGVKEPQLPLPIDSPFGTVSVNTAACTLCMACVTICPSGALSTGGDVPRLTFRESRCHQCGLCEAACPEGAVRLLPRLLCDQDAVDAPAVLHEAEPFLCVECGAPFAPPSMVARMQEKLSGHWMYANERQVRRLRMCGTCRTRDALLSKEMTSWDQR